jgi:diguanylate cyclase (GGDEF)-like protein/PAS domain S-box-containing protein
VTASLPSPAGTTRLLTRFLRLLLPVFLLASSIGLYLLGAVTFGDERSTIVTRVGNVAARTASALNKLPAGDVSVQQNAILSLLLADPAITCAQLFDSKRQVLAAAPARVGCRNTQGDATTTVPVASLEGAALHVRYHLTELEDRSQIFRIFTLFALLGSLGVATAASWFSFRLIVGRPVNALLNGIRTTHLLGKPTKIDHVPDDELGAVILAFNDMQDKLEDEARSNKEALRRLDYIYNETPALMFSIDGLGTIVTASGHWLDETGYRREDIVGAPLGDFLTAPAGTDFAAIQKTIVTAERPLRDIPFSLTCKNGGRRDVLMAVVPDIEAASVSKLCVLSDISGLREAQVELRRQAVTDHLTGLPNRQGLFEHLMTMKGASAEQREKSALLFIDLDNFKTVNDTLGHEAGDKLLRAAAGRLRNAIARKDFLARLGGDEFAIVLHGMSNVSDAAIVSRRIIEAFSNPFRLGEASAVVGTSIGIANFSNSEDSDDVLRLADLAMYKSKQSGKNCISNYTDDLTAKVVDRDLMVRRIRDALANHRFTFHYQPIVSLETLKPVGMEALLRLENPEGGTISPTEIIKAAEETGLIGAISTWTTAEGIAVAERHQQHIAERERYLAINLSPKQINEGFVSEVVARLRANPRIARSLVFEITETALFRQDEDVGGMLASIRSTGARIALDDFGTGYSSLGHIQRFPVDFIKLDGTFVRGLADENEDARRRRAVIKATAALAHDLGMSIVAEGIEDHESLAILKSFGIGYGQGYLFSQPVPAPAIMAWMDAFDRPVKAANIIPLQRANINGR